MTNPTTADLRSYIESYFCHYMGDPRHDDLAPALAAFDELVRKAERIHASDCALHNGPALPVGPCDCGVDAKQTSEWVCDDCHGAGQVSAGSSGLDSDGNAPLSEACPTCDGRGRWPIHSDDVSAPPSDAQQPDDTKVICPACAHQFRAVPLDVQRRLTADPAPTLDAAIAAINDFEIVGDNNDSREPTDEEKFILREFVARLFEK